MSLGISDLKKVIHMPGAWDLAYLKRFNGKEGSRVDFEQLMRFIGASFSAFNASLTTGYLSKFIYVQTDPETEYGAGGGNKRLPKLSEHAPSNPITGDSTGHMIPMYDFGGGLGWSYWALRRSPMRSFQNDLRELVTASRNTWDYELYNRMFSKNVVTVSKGGKSYPFLDNGVAEPGYIPTSRGGHNFTANENHYRRYTDDAAGRAQYLNEAGKQLGKLGNGAPWELIIPDADKAKWTSLNEATAKFVKPNRELIFITNGVETRAKVNEEEYIGAIETPDGYFMVHATARVESGYAHASHAYGYNDPRNPLAVRHEEGFALGLSLVATINHFPLENAQSVFTFGVGVKDRANGFNAKFAANGNYTNPVIN